MVDTRNLLIEIGTEELPPKSLKKLAQAFAEGVKGGLVDAGVAGQATSAFATPRRMAVIVEAVPSRQADSEVERRGPALQAAFDADGNATKAAQGFARSCGVGVADLRRNETDRGTWLVYTAKKAGVATVDLLETIVVQTLEKLPIPKRMRWGSGDAEFVRPVHWVCAMFGEQIVPCSVLGVTAGGSTYGHRFHAGRALAVQADNYAQVLLDEGRVVADFARRREMIATQIEECSQQAGGSAMVDENLLDEVTALVEWPVALVGEFASSFLSVPQEVLITTLQDNQKYFPLRDASGALLPKFIAVANIKSSNPESVKQGNERVVRPRLADAIFFWKQDRKQSLAQRAPGLQNVLFQKQLGTLAAKVSRVVVIARSVAGVVGADVEHTTRAVALAKCDLLTDMVAEFPSLQGVMGEYYARHDGEPEAVSIALREQYLPRHASDSLPASAVGQTLAIAERIDTLVGIFAIGQKPTGIRDPFALRRAALGVLRIVIERELPVDLRALIDTAAGALDDDLNASECCEEVFEFIVERLRAYYAERKVNPQVFDAVLASRPTAPLDFDKRIAAVQQFAQLVEAESLAAANKRTRNILKKVDIAALPAVDVALLSQLEEKALYQAMTEGSERAAPAFAAAEYAQGLKILADLRAPVDAFFDAVMVMADDEDIRNNRLALLRDLAELFGRVADISRLSGAS